MRYLFVLLAILCGIALIAKMATGTIDPQQLAGIGVVLLGLAVVSPAGWPSA